MVAPPTESQSKLTAAVGGYEFSPQPYWCNLASVTGGRREKITKIGSSNRRWSQGGYAISMPAGMLHGAIRLTMT